MTQVNATVNVIIDYMFTKNLKKNYIQGVTTMEELAGTKSELSNFAYDKLMKNLKTNDERQQALQIISRIEL